MGNLFFDLDENDKEYDIALSNAVNGEENSGFELKDEILLDANALTDEFPEANENIMIALESYIHRLIDFDDRMKKNGGISKGMAHELLELIPSLEGYVKPSMFTNHPSLVNAEVSNESITKQIWVLIAAGAAIILSILYKFIKKIRGSKSKDTNVKSIVENITKTISNIEDLKKVLDELKTTQVTFTIPKDIDIEAVKTYRIPEQLKEAIIYGKKEYSNTIGELIYSFSTRKYVKYVLNIDNKAKMCYLPDSEAYKFFKDSVSDFGNHIKVLLTSTDLIEKAVDQLSDKTSNPTNSLDSLRKNSIAFQLGEKTYSMKPIKVNNITFNDYVEWKDHLIKEVKEVGDINLNTDQLDLLLGIHLKALTSLSQLNYKQLSDFSDSLKSIFVTFEKINKLGKMKESGAVDGASITNDEKEFIKDILKSYSLLKPNLDAIIYIYEMIRDTYVKTQESGFKIVDQINKNFASVMSALEKYNKEQYKEIYEKYKELDKMMSIIKSTQSSMNFGNLSVS